MTTLKALTAAVVRAFAAEFTAARKSDATLRALFVAIATATVPASQTLKDVKAGSSDLSSSERKARCIPSNAAQVTGAWFVGTMVGTYHDDMGDMFDIRQAWDMAAAVANEAKHGGGKAALTDILAGSSETLSEAVMALSKADASVKSKRKAADAADRKATKGETGETGESSESENAETTSTVDSKFASVLSVLSSIADDVKAGYVLTDADRAAHARAVEILNVIGHPTVTVSIPNDVAAITETVNA